jgi:hypothetical protein
VLVQPVEAVHRVDARAVLELFRVLGREQLALGGLACLVAVRQVQGRTPLLPVDQQVGVRRLDAGEVVELVRLPEADVTGRARRPLHQREALADRVHHLGTARGELVGREIAREERSLLGTGACGEKTRCED